MIIDRDDNNDIAAGFVLQRKKRLRQGGGLVYLTVGLRQLLTKSIFKKTSFPSKDSGVKLVKDRRRFEEPITLVVNTQPTSTHVRADTDTIGSTDH